MTAYQHILGFNFDIFKITPVAIDVNDSRSLRTATLVRDALRNMNESIARAEVLVLGASYRENVGDMRYSGSELIIRKLAEMGEELRAHDPFVDHWWGFETQETYSSTNHSKARFFRNQERLKNNKNVERYSFIL